MLVPTKKIDRDRIAKIALFLAQHENESYLNKSDDYNVYEAVNVGRDGFMGFCIGRAMTIHNIMQS